MMADRLLPTTTTSGSAAACSPEQRRQHQPPVPLKCPRCDSSNTKFCYYNNYSLSQPRHFCKACKRYWTRGGTLRNVPVGGGCRKNKTAKKPASRSDQAPPAPAPRPPVSLPTDTNNLNSLLYGLVSQPNTQICSIYDLQPQLNALGLKLPHNRLPNAGFVDDYLAQLQQPVTTSAASILHDYPLFGSSSSASYITTSLKQQQQEEELQVSGSMNLGLMKEVKMEGLETNGMGGDKIEWQIPCANSYGTASAVVGGDSAFMYWNPSTAWPEAANCGSSITPLI